MHFFHTCIQKPAAMPGLQQLQLYFTHWALFGGASDLEVHVHGCSSIQLHDPTCSNLDPSIQQLQNHSDAKLASSSCTTHFWCQSQISCMQPGRTDIKVHDNCSAAQKQAVVARASRQLKECDRAELVMIVVPATKISPEPPKRPPAARTHSEQRLGEGAKRCRNSCL